MVAVLPARKIISIELLTFHIWFIYFYLSFLPLNLFIWIKKTTIQKKKKRKKNEEEGEKLCFDLHILSIESEVHLKRYFD